MTLVYYPDPIFKKQAEIVTDFDDTLHHNIAIMQKTMRDNRAIGVGANMCGILQRIIIVPSDDTVEENKNMVMINPEIIEKSKETQIFTEASLSLPGIDAQITRPATITVQYQDIQQNTHTLTVTGFVATVIQHEIDYLNGIVYLDYLPKSKAVLLREKMQKYLKKVDRHGTQDTHQHYHDGKLCTHKH
jgi:peptide deformylase